MKTKKTNRANSAKETEKRVNNRAAAAAEKPAEAIPMIEAVDVETVDTQATAASALPVAKETVKSEKVSSKEVLKAAGSQGGETRRKCDHPTHSRTRRRW